ncbi:MAG: PDZ domain-containing protein [Dokdonella sp.]|uniref:PDZ domain-containing protein n=1 Tax=Dokdonella sp. TaxID=2291710 RepID=UPI003F7DF6D6
MNHTRTFLALALVAGTAGAADAPATASAAPRANAGAHVVAKADAAADATAVAKAEAARRELGELRTQMRDLSRRMADLSTQLGDVGPRAYAFRYIGDTDRAMIGVVLGVEDGHVVLGALTPDGPAARAGLRSSDVVTAIDGQAVAAKTPRESLDRARGLLANLKEGQTVSIEYQRGAQKGVVVVNAERREALNWPALMNEDPEHPFLPRDFSERIRADVERASRAAEREAQREVARDAARTAREAMAQAREHMNSKEVREAFAKAREAARHAMPWWGLNLAPMNGELGHYFGVDRGALVIASDEASLPGVRGGDVITEVGKEPITRPEDVMRVLRDQPEGEDVAIKLMRDRKVLALTMKTPEFKSIFSVPAPPALPAVPAAPAMPAHPAAPVAPTVPAPAAVPAPVAPPPPPAPPSH